MIKIAVFVATHKPYEFPSDDMYIPMQVGCSLASEDFGYAKDNDTEDNISHKNPYYCELTALYQIWKNEIYKSYDYIGLCHYRRYFSGKKLSFEGKKILDYSVAKELLKQYDAILPKKRNYIIETVYSHYCNAHYKQDMDLVYEIIRTKYPEYFTSLKEVLNSRSLHLFNMFILKRQDFDRYMEWIFGILSEVEKQIDIDNYDDYQKRVFGFLSERLFNVWIKKNNLKIKHLNVENIEGENLLLKAYGLIKRKLKG